MTDPVNRLDEHKAKNIDFLGAKDFLSILQAYNLEPYLHNILVAAHISCVMSQSQGVKDAYVHYSYWTLISSTDEDKLVNCPSPKVDYHISLSRNAYITPKNYTGSGLTVRNKNFDFYRSRGAREWIEINLKSMKSYPAHTVHTAIPDNNCEIKFSFNREEKKSISLLYDNLIDGHSSVKQFLNFHFLNNKIPDMPNNVIKKLKI